MPLGRRNTTGSGQYSGNRVPSIQRYLGMDEQYQQDRNSLLTNFRNFRLLDNRETDSFDDNSQLMALLTAIIQARLQGHPGAIPVESPLG